MSSSLNRCSVSGWSGALIVTTSQTGTINRIGVKRETELALDLLWQPMAVGVVQLDVEGLQAPQYGLADPPRGDGADAHALEIVGPRYAIGDVPAVLNDPLVGGDVVPHQRQDHP